jgi:hypothetical protein
MFGDADYPGELQGSGSLGVPAGEAAEGGSDDNLLYIHNGPISNRLN